METVVEETLLLPAARELLISVRASLVFHLRQMKTSCLLANRERAPVEPLQSGGLERPGGRLGSNKPKLKMVRKKKQLDNMLTFWDQVIVVIRGLW